MTEFLSVFLNAQATQSLKWLLNYQLYVAVAFCFGLTVLLPAEPWSRRQFVSTLHDFLYGIVHTLVLFPVIAVYLWSLDILTDQYAPWLRMNLITDLPIWAQILIAAVITDLLKYLSHYLRHRIKALWYFHTIHHSQLHLNPFTTKRTHLVEHLFEKGLILWIPLAVMGSPVEVWFLYYAFDAFWDYFIHSNVRITLGPFRWVLVTPQFHRVHHSSRPEHFDKNFGDRFVVWDLLFGTAYMESGVYPPTGVPDVPFDCESSARPLRMLLTYGRQFWYPFKMIADDLRDKRPPSGMSESRIE